MSLHVGVILCLALAPPAPGAVKVHLSCSAAAAPTPEGFLPAKLHVADPNGELAGVVRGIGLRRKAGGPAVLYVTSVAPRASQVLDVLLPALSVQESYVVGLFAGEEPAAAALVQREIPVTFPDVGAVERARSLLIDPGAYEPWLEELPHWPARLVRTVFLTAALVCVMLGGALFVRPPAARICAVVLVAAAGTVASVKVVSAADVVLSRRAEGLTVMTCRRTASWSCPASDLGCVYWSRRQFEADDAVYRPGGHWTLTLRPADVRIFRRRPATAPASQASGS